MINQNRRQFFRLELTQSLCSELEIVKIRGKSIQSSTAKVCILDIGPGGLRFLSDLQLPISNEIVLEFRFTLMDEFLKVIGMIARREDLPDGIFAYGVQFTIFEDLQNLLTRHINRLTIRQRSGSHFHNCSICTKEEQEKCMWTKYK